MIILGLLTVAAGLMAIAIVVYVGNPRSTDLPIAIQAVAPEPQTNVLSQSDVVVDLAVGYTAEIDINGIPVPEDQLFRVEGLNQLTFQPGAGQVIERLAPDQNCVRVRYWLIATGSADSSLFTWCFDAS